VDGQEGWLRSRRDKIEWAEEQACACGLSPVKREAGENGDWREWDEELMATGEERARREEREDRERRISHPRGSKRAKKRIGWKWWFWVQCGLVD
jgi:hypothetical protein